MTDKKRLYEIIPDSSNIRRSLDLAEKYGAVFEYNDFMLPGYLDDRAECRRKLIFYKSLGRDCSNDTLHGAFIDISVHSEIPGSAVHGDRSGDGCPWGGISYRTACQL